ncbi:MAG: glycosyltransferase [Lachnospiraceae bacterium]|nr:glycosyltransferase [Lachnospiraceae bacterium]
MEDRISIVIPAYNAEKYIENCIESLVRQSYQNMEIIIVNDGSADRTEEKVEEIQSKYSGLCLQYLKLNENKGQSNARNEGMKIATGTYLMFLDADDTFDPEMLSIMHDAVSSSPEIDLAVCGFYRCRNGIVSETGVHIKTGKQSLTDFLSQSFAEMPLNYLSCIGTKIYKMDLIRQKKIYFSDKYRFNEDLGFALSYLMHTNRVFVIDQELYCYHYVVGSVQHKKRYREGSLETMVHTRLSFADLLKTAGVFEERKFATSMVEMYFGEMLCQWENYRAFKKVYDKIGRKNKYVKQAWKERQGIILKLFKMVNLYLGIRSMYLFLRLVYGAKGIKNQKMDG